MMFKVYALLALCTSHVAALNLSKSNWIWTDSGYMTVPPFVIHDFRREVLTLGDFSVSSQILIAADNNYTLFVNGEYIGQGYDWTQSQQYCARLNPTHNTFAVAVENQPYSPGSTTPNPAAFIAAIQINYADGSSNTIVTDSRWVGNNETAGFQSPSFNDAGWPNAYVAGSATSAPWRVPANPVGAGSLALAYSYWVWTNEVPPNSPMSNAPIGSRAFRKKIAVGGGSTVRTGTIIIDADNEYDLYINGNLIGSGNDWRLGQLWEFTLDRPTHEIVIAVKATNTGYQAGLMAAVALDAVDCSCSSTLFYITDGSWKYAPNHDVPIGFEQPGYDDSAWPNVVVEGLYGVQPWLQVPWKKARDEFLYSVDQEYLGGE